MNAKVLKISGKSAVVAVGGKCFIISKTAIGTAHVGTVADIEEEVILTGTEYGLDWDIIMPEGLSVNSQKLQESLYSYGILTYEDLKANPNSVVAAISKLAKSMAIELIRSADKALGGTE